MHNYKELRVWEKAVDFAVDVYKSTETLPSDERFGLTSQIRRASISIPNNIADGCGRNSENELNHFFTISVGSASEVDYLFTTFERFRIYKSNTIL